MAARGRGRGAAGRGRGQGGAVKAYLRDDFKLTADGIATQPPPLYPSLPKPIPLELGPEYHSRLKSRVYDTSSTPFHFLREELTANWKLQLQHLFKEKTKKDVDRYSDRIRKPAQIPQRNYDIDFNRIPQELKPFNKKHAKSKLHKVSKKPRLDETVLQNLDGLEQKEREDGEGDPEEEEKKPEEEEEENEEDPYESDYDVGDYNENYFDNGEKYGDDSDGSGGEACY